MVHRPARAMRMTPEVRASNPASHHQAGGLARSGGLEQGEEPSPGDTQVEVAHDEGAAVGALADAVERDVLGAVRAPSPGVGAAAPGPCSDGAARFLHRRIILPANREVGTASAGRRNRPAGGARGFGCARAGSQLRGARWVSMALAHGPARSDVIASRTVSSWRRWALAAVLAGVVAPPAAAQTEFQFQYGNLVNPFSAESTPSRILTFQQASGWSLGDSFFFIDYIDDGLGDGFNDKDFYGEWYPTLSFGKMSGRMVGGGALRDVALIGGINFGGDADFFKYLPGARLSWAVPGFFFLNTDFTAFINGNTASAAPRTSNSWMFDGGTQSPRVLRRRSCRAGRSPARRPCGSGSTCTPGARSERPAATGAANSWELNGYSERALSERIKELEVHREYAATREDVTKLTAEVEKRFTALTAAVANINVNMATKTWILGGILALVIALATAAASAWFRTLFQ